MDASDLSEDLSGDLSGDLSEKSLGSSDSYEDSYDSFDRDSCGSYEYYQECENQDLAENEFGQRYFHNYSSSSLNIHSNNKVRQQTSMNYMTRSHNTVKICAPSLMSDEEKIRNLTSFIKSRWPFSDTSHIQRDASYLLNRKLQDWEKKVLNHLLKYSPLESKVEDTVRRYNVQSINLVAIGFVDIIQVLSQIGVNLSCVDERGDDILIIIARYHFGDPNSVELIEFLIRSGVDIMKNGSSLVVILCDLDDDIILKSPSSTTLKIMETLFAAGVKLNDKVKTWLLSLITRHLLEKASSSALGIVHLLLKQGCDATNTIREMQSFYSSDDELNSPENINSLIDICTTLIEHGALITPEKNEPFFLFNILKVAQDSPAHISMLSLLRMCINRGLKLNVAHEDNKNLLLAFCSCYKGEDLVEVIRFLLANGIKINYLDRNKNNALMCLCDNNPLSTQAVYDAVRTLLESGININQSNLKGNNALMIFLSHTTIRRCNYERLQIYNRSRYWDTLAILINSGSDINKKNKMEHTALHLFLRTWVTHPHPGTTICKKCRKANFPQLSKDEAKNSWGYSFIKGILDALDHFIQVGTNLRVKFGLDNDASVVLYVCARFNGELILGVLDVLCKNGIDVNAILREERRHQNASAGQVIKHLNQTQKHYIPQVEELLNSFQFTKPASKS